MYTLSSILFILTCISFTEMGGFLPILKHLCMLSLHFLPTSMLLLHPVLQSAILLMVPFYMLCDLTVKCKIFISRRVIACSAVQKCSPGRQMRHNVTHKWNRQHIITPSVVRLRQLHFRRIFRHLTTVCSLERWDIRSGSSLTTS